MEAFAAALRRLRVERGMSLRGLAALAPLDVGYLSKIENGHRKVTLSVARAVDAALDAKGELVALARIERAARVRQAIPFDPMRRRTLLKWGLTAPALIEPPTVSDPPRLGKIGLADAVELNDNAAWLYNLDHQHGGATLWHAAAACVSSGYSMLEHGTYSDVVERRLLKATGRMQMCAGWLAFDAGRQDMARSCYTEALALARQAGDSEVETHALANLAFQSNLLGRPREAARFTEGAVRAAASPHGKARLTAIPQLRRAIASALSSDHTSQDRAITAARKVIDDEGDKPAEEWCAFLGPAELDGVEGTCLIELGKPRRAESLFQQAITGYTDHYARNRALYRVRLARARLDMRTADGAAEAANEALDELTSQVSSWRVRSELNAVADRLAAHTHLPQAALFLHRYAESLRRS